MVNKVLIRGKINTSWITVKVTVSKTNLAVSSVLFLALHNTTITHRTLDTAVVK